MITRPNHALQRTMAGWLWFRRSAAIDQQTSVAADAIPQPAAEAILRAFETHALVAIGESHRNQQVHDFILALVNDPRFAERVDDIVVEFGSADHQDVVDRFTEGQDVPL